MIESMLPKTFINSLIAYALTSLLHGGTQTINQETQVTLRYLQFMMIIIVLDILIYTFQPIKKGPNKSSVQPHIKQDELGLPIIDKLGRKEGNLGSKSRKVFFYGFKIICFYSMCYFLFLALFFCVEFSLNVDIPKESLTSQKNLSMKIKSRLLEEVSPILSSQNKLEDFQPNTNQRMLSPIAQTSGQVLSSFDIATGGLVMISNDSNTAFIMGQNQVQVFDISNKQAPMLLAITTVLEYTITPLNMENSVLSPDNRAIFVMEGNYTISVMQIIDVSNLASPVLVSNFSLPGLLVSDPAFSSDGMTLYTFANLGIHVGYTSYTFNIIDIMDLSSPKLLSSTPFDFYGNLKAFKLYKGLIYIPSCLGFITVNVSNPTFDFSPCPNEGGNTQLSYSNTFSPASQLAYFVNENIGETETTLLLQIINTTSIVSSTFISQLSTALFFDDFTYNYPTILSGNYLFIQGYYLQVFDVSNPITPTLLPIINLPNPLNVAISSDQNFALISTYSQVFIVQLYLNIQPNQVFSWQNNIIGTYDTGDTVQTGGYEMIMSPNGQILYVNQAKNQLQVLDTSNPVSISLSGSFEIPNNTTRLSTSPDGSTLYLVSQLSQNYSQFTVYSFTTMQILSSLSLYTGDSNGGLSGSITSCTTSPDGNTVFLLGYGVEGDKGLLFVVDVSNPTNLSSTRLENLPTLNSPEDIPLTLSLSEDGKLLFLSCYNYMCVYNGSNLTSSLQDVYFPPFDYSPMLNIITSSDSQTAFLITYNQNIGANALQIIDMSTNSTISETFLSQETKADSVTIVLQDDQTLYVLSDDSVLVIDVSSLASPRITAYYNILMNMSILAPDFQTVFMTNGIQNTTESTLYIEALSLRPEYMIYPPPANVSLGQPSSVSLKVLKRNPVNSYEIADLPCKFIQISLYSIQYQYTESNLVTTYEPLPSWVAFDNYQTLTFTPTLASQIGILSLVATISTQLNENVFINASLNSVNNSSDSKALISSLISLGYLDNEYFLTSSFDPTQELVLSPEYSDDEDTIRNILATFYAGTTFQVSIISSLVITLGDLYISINTPSLNPLNLNIQLTANNNGQAQFISTIDYPLLPTFTTNNTQITVVGSMGNMNLVLSQLVVYLNNTTPCDGTITITDGLNPTQTQFIPNITSYFSNSTSPFLNTSYLFSQIQKVPIKTGEQFIIQFDPSTFIDANGQVMTLSLEMQDGSREVPNWLSLKGYVLSGSPPQQLSEREINLAMTVSNQYQFAKTEFTLNVEISLSYFLSLIARFLTTLITVYGSLVYGPKIYNIIFKTWYKYSKDFTVIVGQTITPNTLYPIAFIPELLAETRLIVDGLNKKISKDTIKKELDTYFLDSRTGCLDKVKLMKKIEEVTFDMLNTNQTKLKYYARGAKSQIEIINQLVIAEFTLKLVDSNKEKPTKMAFKAIEKKIFNLVSLNECQNNGICKFSVDKQKLDLELQVLTGTKATFPNKKINIELSEPIIKETNLNESIRSSQSFTTESAFEQMIGERESTPAASSTNIDQNKEINMNFLIDAVEAYAFKNHNLDINETKVSIEVNKKRPDISFFLPIDAILNPICKFLKWDLQGIGYTSKGQPTFYGIKWEIQKNFLDFSGTPLEEIRDQKIVIQIVKFGGILSFGGTILREIWLTGVNNADTEKEPLKINEN